MWTIYMTGLHPIQETINKIQPRIKECTYNIRKLHYQIIKTLLQHVVLNFFCLKLNKKNFRKIMNGGYTLVHRIITLRKQHLMYSSSKLTLDKAGNFVSKELNTFKSSALFSSSSSAFFFCTTFNWETKPVISFCRWMFGYLTQRPEYTIN